jgi:isoleucyl-tRNA synthetase
LEGSDQHRGWFHSSLLVSCMLNGAAPYRALLTHGFVVDGSGRKMSKSLGNTIVPQEVSSKLGAEVLRLWVASTDYSGELSISDEILKRVVESYRRIRNTIRFLLANLADYDHSKHELPVDQWVEIDQYAILRAQELQIEYKYTEYDFDDLAREVQYYCSEFLGAFYLDVLKDRLYTTKADSHARRSAQNALYHITHALLRWIAPILSFTAEEAWATWLKSADDSVFLHTWHEWPKVSEERQIKLRWTSLMAIRSEILKRLEQLRVAGKIGSSLQAEIEFFADDANDLHFQKLKDCDDDLRFVLMTSKATLVPGDHPDALAFAAFSKLKARVEPTTHTKCVRCWHYRADVGADAAHPELCGRCVANLYGSGERRTYA